MSAMRQIAFVAALESRLDGMKAWPLRPATLSLRSNAATLTRYLGGTR